MARDLAGRFKHSGVKGSSITASHMQGWGSVATGIGDPTRDKRMTAAFCNVRLTYRDAINLWTRDDMAKRVVEFPPSECFREGYELAISDENSFDDLKDQIDQRLQDLNVNGILRRALEMERAVGGCAILVGYKDKRPLNMPVDLKNATDIEWFSLLEPVEIFPTRWYTSVKDGKNYGKPSMYGFTGTSPGSNTTSVMEGRLPPPSGEIHESRIIIFEGHKVSRYQTQNSLAMTMWGESELAPIVELLRDFHMAWSAASILATDFGAPTLTIPNLMNLVLKHPKELSDRLAALQMTLSTARVIALDPKETYERKSTNLAGLAELLTQISLRLSAGTGIPLRLLMGQIPTTIGETDTDIRVFYDHIRGIQTNKLSPILRQIIGILMRTLRQRGLPKRWRVKWHPLWTQTDHEQAESRLAQARVDSMYIKMGAVTPDEIRRSRFVGEYSFETSVDESKQAPGIPMPPTPAGAVAQPEAAKVTSAAAPAAAGITLNQAGGHAVRGYARKAAVRNTLGDNPKQGGDVPTGDKAERRDSAYTHLDSDAPLYYMDFAGFKIGIESPAGSTRTYATGSTVMQNDYGFISGVGGMDGDCLDCFLGPDPSSKWVTIINTLSPSSGFTSSDEQKVFLGFASPGAAMAAFLNNYDDPRFLGGMSALSLDDFRFAVLMQKTESGITSSVPTASPLSEDSEVCAECGDLLGEDHAC